ncbi:hypothetical protein MalM25_37960 [Planctomycetes bacterium MalM25]|nr:hypothetical protein MalM25_37960 [Planctomycetes bacterium MalM25]
MKDAANKVVCNPDQAWSGLFKRAGLLKRAKLRVRLVLTLSALAILLGSSQTHAASPAVEAALALPRTEPRHYVDTALTLTDLGAPNEAALVAGELAQLDLDDESLVRLVDRVGTAKLVRLGREQPALAPLVDRALTAADTAAHSPERLAQLVDALGGSREAVIEAIRALRRTGPGGVDYCLAELAKADDTRRARLREALVALDPISQPALFLATGDEDPQVRVEALYALGRLAELNRLRTPIAPAMAAAAALEPGRAGDAGRWAYQQMRGGPLTVAGAKHLLDGAITELLGGPVLFSEAAAIDDRLALRLAARLAEDRAEIDPSDSRAARTALLLKLESGEADPEAANSEADLSSLLTAALDKRLHRAARLACETLGGRADSAALLTGDGRLAPLAVALEAAHPAVRFAAVEAVLKINPRSPFPGSSRVADALLHFATATGDDAAVVAYPQLAKAGQAAGWLLGSGYTATPAHRGADLVRIATESPDTVLVMLDLSVSLPDARETLFRLRRSPATALTPVALLAADGRFGEAQRVAEEHGGEAAGVVASPRPHTAEATASLAERLGATLPADWPTAEQRLAQATAAREALAQLIEEGPAFYGLDRRTEGVMSVVAMTQPTAAMPTLVEIGTPESQLRLLDLASYEARPLDQRQAAAEAFGQSVERHGVLLTTDQIRRQYDRYNASAKAPAETQAVLGGLLDTLEGARE